MELVASPLLFVFFWSHGHCAVCSGRGYRVGGHDGGQEGHDGGGSVGDGSSILAPIPNFKVKELNLHNTARCQDLVNWIATNSTCLGRHCTKHHHIQPSNQQKPRNTITQQRLREKYRRWVEKKIHKKGGDNIIQAQSRENYTRKLKEILCKHSWEKTTY